MTDAEQLKLAERLRRRAMEYNDRGGSYFYIGDDCALDDLAADTIERLRRPNPSGDADVREAAEDAADLMRVVANSLFNAKNRWPVQQDELMKAALRIEAALTENASTDRAARVEELEAWSVKPIKAVIDCLDFTEDGPLSNEDDHYELPPKLSSALNALTNAYNDRAALTGNSPTDRAGELEAFLTSVANVPLEDADLEYLVTNILFGRGQIAKKTRTDAVIAIKTLRDILSAAKRRLLSKDGGAG
jgi:hypothetical protein